MEAWPPLPYFPSFDKRADVSLTVHMSDCGVLTVLPPMLHRVPPALTTGLCSTWHVSVDKALLIAGAMTLPTQLTCKI